MDNTSCNGKEQHTQTRVQTLQASWPTGDVVQPDAIDWNERVRKSVQAGIRSKLFLAATIFLTIAAAPFVAILPLCPQAWMSVGLWIMYAQSRKNHGEIGQLGFNFLMIGQYFHFCVSIVGTLIAIILMVEGCTDAGKEYTQIQNALFWITFLDFGLLSLLVFLRWKVLVAVKTIKNAYEGISNDGMISMGSVVSCFVLGGIVGVLSGIMLALYRKDMIKLDEDMLAQEWEEAERKEIVPTWKMIEEE